MQRSGGREPGFLPPFAVVGATARPRVQPAAALLACAVALASLLRLLRPAWLGAWELAVATPGAPWQPLTWLLLTDATLLLPVAFLAAAVGQLTEQQTGTGAYLVLVAAVGTGSAAALACSDPAPGRCAGATLLLVGLAAVQCVEQLFHRARQLVVSGALLGASLVLAYLSLHAPAAVVGATATGALAGVAWHLLAERGRRRYAVIVWAALALTGEVSWLLASR